MASRYFASIAALIGLFIVTMLPIGSAADPDLQLHVDFEEYEWDDSILSSKVPDRSNNRFEVVVYIFGKRQPELVPTKLGHALMSRKNTYGRVHSDGNPIYRRGDGLTVSAWVRMKGYTTVYPLLVRDEGKDVVRMSVSRRADGVEPSGVLAAGFAAFEQDARTLAFAGVGTKILPATFGWVHYAGVYDPRAESAALYVDGDEIARNTSEGRPYANWGNLTPDDVLFYWNTPQNDPIWIDEIRWYSRALDADEIRDLMSLGSPLDVSERTKIATSWGDLKQR